MQAFPKDRRTPLFGTPLNGKQRPTEHRLISWDELVMGLHLVQRNALVRCEPFPESNEKTQWKLEGQTATGFVFPPRDWQFAAKVVVAETMIHLQAVAAARGGCNSGEHEDCSQQPRLRSQRIDRLLTPADAGSLRARPPAWLCHLSVQPASRGEQFVQDNNLEISGDCSPPSNSPKCFASL
jgi:hypothetical protein